MGRALPARFPPAGSWPGLMRADVAAAYFDCANTDELERQIRAGDAPVPTSTRGRGRQREPVWTLNACQRFVASRHDMGERGPPADNIAELV